MQCPACDGSGITKEVDAVSIHYHPCRGCGGLGEFPEANLLERIKGMKTWPDSIRQEHGE